MTGNITLKTEFQDIISGYANSAIAAQYWAEVDRAYAQKGSITTPCNTWKICMRSFCRCKRLLVTGVQ